MSRPGTGSAISPRRKKARQARRIGPAELTQILDHLNEWIGGRIPGKLSWQHLERFSGFSRQALSGKNEIATLFERVKITQRDGVQRKRPATVDDRIQRLRAQVQELRHTLDNYDDRWSRIAYHCSAQNIDLDALQRPLPPLNRGELRVTNSRLRKRI